MKIRIKNLVSLCVLGASPLACSTVTTDLPLDDACVQMGLDRYEFKPIGGDASAPFGSFEPDGSGELVGLAQGELVVDDDDLTDDYPLYEDVVELFEAEVAAHPTEVATWESMDPDADESTYTPEQIAAAAFVRSLEDTVIQSGKCARYPTASAPTADEPLHIDAPVPGSPLVPPRFTTCKDSWSQSGDGVVGLYSLAAREVDQVVAACGTVTGTPNTTALNFWGPLTVDPPAIEGDLPQTIDGFNYSGVTIPLQIAPYQQTVDLSAWEGIAFWARLAVADEAVPVGPTPGNGESPLAGDPIPVGARPQDGTGQLGVILQTADTAAMDFGLGARKIRVCAAGADPLAAFCFATVEEFQAFDGPELIEEGNEAAGPYKWALASESGAPASIPQPFCVDYSPVDERAPNEVPFRNQCWDGFRTMVEITTEWKFYFLPFDEMRQAGWGQVGESFRIDNVRSINLLTSAFQSVNHLVDEVALYRKRP